MWQYWRTALSLATAAVIWFGEDFLFTRGLGLGRAQTAVVSAYFVALFIAALWAIRRLYSGLSRAPQTSGELEDGGIPIARLISLAPMLVVVLGSFVALPVIILTLVIGAWL